MNAMAPRELLFSRDPKISVADVRGWLDKRAKGDNSVKNDLINFIDHRLRGRYVLPLEHVPREFKSGFLMMASACLLIEALQTFHDGKNESRHPNFDASVADVGSEAAFIRFFNSNGEYFHGLRATFPFFTLSGRPDPKCSFYKHIRCGILHQAETTGGYRIVRDDSPLFDSNEKTVNAKHFLSSVKGCLDKFINNLKKNEIAAGLWEPAAIKLKYICDNFENPII